MASVTFPRNEIEKHIKLSEENVDKIRMMGIPVEKVTDDEIEIEILANRPDLISMQGFLRSVKAYLGKDEGLQKYKVNKSDYKLIVNKNVPKEWPYAVACVIKDLKFNDARIKEIIDIQEKLGATVLRRRKKGGIGVYPLNKIKFPIEFKGLNPDEIKFRPLEFPDEITGRQILSKHPTGREYASIIEKWEKYPVFTDNQNKIMSMPPIINSHDLGKIDETTKDIFVESTGNDLNTIKKALSIIVTALSDMGGKIYSIECTQKDGRKENIPNLEPEKMKISVDNANRILGLDLKEKNLEKLLFKMGYEYSKGKVSIPAYRTDILHEVDIIEDIAIAYGYENLTPEIPKVATIGSERLESKTISKISEILIGLGFIEISSYYLIKSDEISNFKPQDKIEIENSKTEYKYLRPNLTIPSIRILSENKDNEYPQKIFEIGPVFKKDEKTESKIKEYTSLVVSITPGNFTEAKRVLDYLGNMLKINFEIKSAEINNMIDGRAAIVIAKGKEIGYIGEMHPEYLRNSGIKMPVSNIEINLSDLII